MKQLESEINAAVVAQIDENNKNHRNDPVVVFLKRRLSVHAEFILKAHGFKIRFMLDRQSLDGKVIEVLRQAVVLL